MMKYEILPECCRICLRKCKKSRSIYQALEEGDETPAVMLQKLTGLEFEMVKLNEKLPQQVCKNCELSLNLAFQFRMRVLKAARIIEEYKKQEPENTSSIKEFNIKKEHEDSSSFKETVTDDELYIDYLSTTPNQQYVEFNDEAVEFMTVLPNEDREENVEYLDDFELEYIEDEEHLNEQNEFINIDYKDSIGEDSYSLKGSLEELPQNPPTTRTSKSNKNEQYNTTQPNNMCVRSYRQRKTRVIDEKGHICDVCGNTYAKRSRMMEHRRRHDKELRFACEICDQRFHVRENLRKHMYIHRGGKPYKCSYCSRSFFYESVKKTHEAVHSGLKPYVCDVCNKAFAYAHALKKHQMIHDEVKLFHCAFCDKDFRLQHHMKQHEETKLHQNAVASAALSINSGYVATDP